MSATARGPSGEEHGYVSHSLRAHVGSPLCAGLSAEALCPGAACPGAWRGLPPGSVGSVYSLRSQEQMTGIERGSRIVRMWAVLWEMLLQEAEGGWAGVLEAVSRKPCTSREGIEEEHVAIGGNSFHKPHLESYRSLAVSQAQFCPWGRGAHRPATTTELTFPEGQCQFPDGGKHVGC